MAGSRRKRRSVRRRSAKRTRSGGVSAQARKKYGSKAAGRKGSFPVFDRKSANSAIKLRGHGNRKAVLDKVARWARKHNEKGILEKVRKARAADKRAGRK